MKADLTKRLFKAIANGSEKDMSRLCKKIIDEESIKGHTLLAKQLESILNTKKTVPASDSAPVIDSERRVSSLPVSKRYQDPLVVRIEQNSLRHFMVLPEEVDSKFLRIEQEYAARDRLGVYGLQHKKKILLYGKPGCGKTLGAERLAWSTGLPLVKVRFDTLISSYLGESGINLRAVFESARQQACLLFLDECDFIAKSRNIQNDVGEIPRLVNTLLQLLDDYDAPGLLVAATNLDSQLDKAIFRRFDDVFEVTPPGVSEIKRLLQMILSPMKSSNTINWDDVSNKLLGMSAADVVKVAQNSAKHVVLTNSKEISSQDILNSYTEIYKSI
jgi:SpoVK/Ycf46/Vps4 family AAA+-type ATPase